MKEDIAYNHVNKKHLFKEAIVITFLIMTATVLLQYFPLNFEITKPIKEEFSDFDLYDIIYSGKANGNHKRDTNIVIFQAGTSRREIANQLNLLQEFHPSVIGVDLTFIDHSNDLQADSLLKNELSMGNVVTGNRIEIDRDSKVQKIMPNFFDSIHGNNLDYFNFWGDEIAVVRYYPPFLRIGNSQFPAFTSRVVERYDTKAFLLLKSKFQKFQLINYMGNDESFTSFEIGKYDTIQLAEKIKGKIVLLGVLYKSFPLVLEDLHFTPLNEKLNGKSFPDMYGVVIQANILSMILAGNYIISLPRILSYLIAIIFTFILVNYQLRFHYKGKRSSDLWFFIMQFVIIIILVYLFLLIFQYLHYKVFLFPIVMPIVLCIGMIEFYKFLVSRLLKRSKYKSIYLNNIHK